MAKNGESKKGKVQVALSKSEVAAKAKELGDVIDTRKTLEARKQSSNKEWNEQLRTHKSEIERLGEEVATEKAWVTANADLYDNEHNAKLNGASKPRTAKKSKKAKGSEARA